MAALLFAMPSVSSSATAADCGSASPTVTTDKPDYGANETALISGSGFACGDVFHVKVTAPDGSAYSGDGTGSPGPDTVSADESGAFSLSYALAGELPWSGTASGSGSYAGQSGTYTVEVISESGEVVATTTFTDASQLGSPVPASVVVEHNGLEWVWASPCALNGCTTGILVGKDGFRFATAAEWALRPPVSAFPPDKCAAPWFDQLHNHCDWGDAQNGIYFGTGLLGSAPIGGAPAGPDGTYPMSSFGETWLVRGLVNLPPAVDAGGPYSGGESTTIPLDAATASDPDGPAPLSYAWTIVGSNVGSGSCSLSNAGSLTDATLTCTDSGTATLLLTASEAGLGLAASDTASVSVDNAAPSVTLSSANTLTWNESRTAERSFSYSASDAAGANDPLAFDVDCGLNGTYVAGSLSFNSASGTGSFKCIFADGPASSTVAVTARDGDGGSASHSQAVTVVNVAPTVSVAGPVSANEGETKTYTYTVSDPGDDPSPTVTEDCGANGSHVADAAPSSFKCTFPDGPATSIVRVTANDGDPSRNIGTSSRTVTVANVAPTVTPTELGRIYWTDHGTDLIQTATIDGANVQTLVDTAALGSTRPAGIAVDPIGARLYWTDSGDFSGQASTGLYGSGLDGASPVAFMTGSAFFAAQGVDVDGARGMLYWGPTHESFRGDISRIRTSNLDGTNPASVLDHTVSFLPGGLGLDLAAGKIYWADTTASRLSRANLDGSNAEIGWIAAGCDVRDVDVDESAGLVYFTCGLGGTIRRVKTDGTGLTTLVTGQAFPREIELDVAAGKMYWTELNTSGPGRIRRANLNGSNVEDVVVGLIDPHGIALIPSPPGTLTGPRSAHEGETKTYSYTVSDPGDDPNPAITEECGAGGTYHGDAEAGSFTCTFPDGPASSAVKVTVDDGHDIGSASKAVGVANVAPSVTLSGAETAEEGETKTYTYSVSDPGDDPSPTVSEECGENGTHLPDADANSFQCAFPDGPAASTVKVTVDDRDPANNTASASKTVNVAGVAPTVTLTGAESANEGETKTYTYAISDPGNESPAVSEQCGENGTYVADADLNSFACTFPDGPASSTVTVTADDGDETGSASKTVTVANVAPTVTLSGAESVSEGETKTYTYSVSDPGDDPAITEACGADGTYASDADANSFVCTFPDGPASSTVKVTADDGDDVGSASKTVTVANVAPKVTLSGADSVSEGETKAYTYSVSDPGDDPSPAISEECGENGAYAADGDAGSFACSFPDGPASSFVQVTADDGDDLGSASKTVSVANVAPTVTLSGPESANEGETKAYSYSVSDPGDDPSPAINEECGASGVYVADADAGSFRCSFPDGPASSTVKVTADDGDDAGSASKTVTVANVAPAVTAPADQSASEGTSKAFDLGSFGDPAADSPWAVDVDWGDGSPHTTFNKAATGSLGAHAHAFRDNGEYTVTVTVDDPDGASDSKAFKVFVANVPPTADAGGPYAAPWGSEVQFDGGGTSDPAGANDTLTYCWDFDYSGSFAADACAINLAKPKHAYAAPGSYVAALRVSDEDGGTSPIDTAAVNVSLRATALANTTAQAAVQYSDALTVSARLTDSDNGPLTGAPLEGKTVTFTITFNSPAQPAMSGITATTDANGNASAHVQILKQAGIYSVAASFGGDGRYKSSTSVSKTGGVKQEDARVEYTGDTIALVGSSLALRATAWDSAAPGYSALNPEAGGGGTMGAIAKMWIAFDIYSATSCGTGAPTATRYAQVQDTGTAGDGIGTASQTYASSSEANYCVVARLVDDGNAANGSTNQWYTAENAQAAVLTFYTNTGKFVTGGGWINDPSGGKGNFGFNARYSKSGAAKGQLVYVYRGLYSGPCTINGVARTCTNVPSDFRIKSTAITRSAFFGSTYPMRSTLEGKATIQINRASDGYVLYSDGNATFSSTVTDTNENGGAGDDFALTVYDKNAVRYKTVPSTVLQGGNVVIHQ